MKKLILIISLIFNLVFLYDMQNASYSIKHWHNTDEECWTSEELPSGEWVTIGCLDHYEVEVNHVWSDSYRSDD